MINQIVEKYLTAYTVRGVTEEVFVNPTSSEVRELTRATADSIGVIMDIKSKQIYFFSRDNLIHSEAWKKFKPNSEGRVLYHTDTLLTAEYELKAKTWNIQSQIFFTDNRTLQSLRDKDWSFFDKWIPNIKKLVDMV